ncbi:MAG: XRE family transcriptional regulator, partial [Bryobacteraceae bacterium]
QSSWGRPYGCLPPGASGTGAFPSGSRIEAADFSRIRNAELGRFTVDRLMSIVNRLGSRVEVKIRVHRAETAAQEARP